MISPSIYLTGRSENTTAVTIQKNSVILLPHIALPGFFGKPAAIVGADIEMDIILRLGTRRSRSCACHCDHPYFCDHRAFDRKPPNHLSDQKPSGPYETYASDKEHLSESGLSYIPVTIEDMVDAVVMLHDIKVYMENPPK